MSTPRNKEITEKNWLEPDIIFEVAVESRPYLKPVSIEVSDYYVKIIRSIYLNESVPDEIHTMFEVAKGAMIYGYFYYPLFTIGLEHLNKAAEAAVRIKYLSSKPEEVEKSLFGMINYMFENKIISEKQKNKWHKLRELRNGASHPNEQRIFPHAMAIEFLKIFSNIVNELFMI